MRPRVRVAVALGLALFACDEEPVSPLGGTGSLTLQLISAAPSEGVAAADGGRSVVFPAPAEPASHLDSAKVTVSGPTAKTVTLTKGASGFSGTVDALAQGTYSVAVMGYAGNAVDYYGSAGNVAVAAGQNATATISWGTFIPTGVTSLPASTAQFRAALQWSAVPGADSYKVELDRDANFPNVIRTTATTTSASVSVTDTGTYYVRVRASNPRVALGRPTGTQTMRVVRNPSEPADDNQATPVSLGAGAGAAGTFAGLNIFPAGDVDWFSFGLCPGDSINVTARAVRLSPASPLNTNLQFFAPDDTPFSASNDADSTDARVGHRTDREGAHKIRVSAGGSPNTGHYELEIVVVPGSGCSGTSVAQVVVTPGSIVAGAPPGGTTALSAEARDASGSVISGKTPSWFSLNPAVATVSSTGLVTTQVSGQTAIAASIDGVVGYASVNFATFSGMQAASSWGTLNTGQGGRLNGIWGFSPNETYWAVGAGGWIGRYNGSAWSDWGSGTNKDLYGIFGFSPTDFFAVGAEGTIIRGGADGPRLMVSGTAQTLYGVWAASPTSVYAVGAGGTILHYNGASWSSMTSPTTQTLYAVSGTSDQVVRAVGGGGTILRYSGSSWALVPSSPTTQTLYGILSVTASGGGDEAFAVGVGGTIVRFSSGSWSAMTSNTTQTLNAVWGTSTQDVYAVGTQGALVRYNGSSWLNGASGTTQELAGVFGSHGGSVYAVGAGGVATRGVRGGGTPAASVAITPGSNSLNGAGTTSIVTAEALDGTGAVVGGKTFTWRGPHPDVATVTPLSATTATVTAVNAGQALIEASADGVTGYGLVTVSVAPTIPVARWTPQTGPSGVPGFYAVWGSAQSNVFVGGGDGRVYRYDGASWTNSSLGDCCGVNALWGLSPTEVYAGHGGTVFRFDGVRWTPQAFGHNQPVMGVWAASPRAIFAVTLDGTIFRYDGVRWDQAAPVSTPLYGVWGTSVANVFAVGAGPTILRWDGATWVSQGLPGGLGAIELHGVWGTSPTNVYAVGDGGTILRFNGSTWGAINHGTGSSSGFKAVWGSSASEIYVVGTDPPVALRYNGSTWSRSDLTTSLRGVWGTAGGDPWAVGDDGSEARLLRGLRATASVSVTPSGASATVPNSTGFSAQPFDADGNAVSRAVSWSSLNPAIATGTTGSIQAVLNGQATVAASADGVNGYALLTVTSALAPVTAWSGGPGVSGGDFSAVWGTSPTDVFAVTRDNQHVSYDGTAWSPMDIGFPHAEDVWGSRHSDVYAVGPAGAISRFDGNGWNSANLPSGTSLEAVWSSDPENVFVAGAGGEIYHSSGDGNWTSMPSPTTQTLRALWGVSRDNVFAVGDGGVILQYAGGGWSPMPTSETWPALHDLWGTGPGDVYAVGDGGTIIRYNGSTWAAMGSPTTADLRAVTGSSGADIYAVGVGGEMLRYDGGAWRYVASVTGNNLDGLWASPGEAVVMVGPNGTVRHGLRQAGTTPAAPSGLGVAGFSATTVDLTWNDNANNEDGYRLERCTGDNATCSGGGFTEIALLRAGANGYTDGGLTQGQTYTYRVRAYNTLGTSAYSNIVEPTPAPSYDGYWAGTTSQASRPITFDVSGNTITGVTFDWTVPATCGTVSGTTNTTFGSPIDVSSGTFSRNVPGSPLSYTLDGTFSSETGVSGTLTLSYSQTVPVSCSGGEAPTWSAVRTAPPPATPSGLAVSDYFLDQVNLVWTDNATDEDGYRVERCEGGGCTSFAEVANLGTNTNGFQNDGLTPRTTYRYRVAAYRGGTNSAYTGIVDVSTVAELTSGVPETGLGGAAGSEAFWGIAVPPGQGQLEVTLTGGSPDADLYVRPVFRPTTTVSDCASLSATNEETCTVPDPIAGEWYVMVRGFTAYSGVTLTATFGGSPAPAWIQLSPTGTPPAARDGHSLVYDEATDRLILFGGRTGTNAPLNDTWVLTNASGESGTPAWLPVTTNTPPAARTGHAAVFDAATNRMTIYGGNNATGSLPTQYDDAWVLTNANGLGGTPTWLSLVSGGPGDRIGHSASYDAATNRMIVFGGNPQEGNCNVLNDVWVLSNANGTEIATPAWANLVPSGTAPSGRWRHRAGYDAANNRLIVSVGDDTCGTTWGGTHVLTNANGSGGTPTWSLIEGGDPNATRFSYAAVYDASSNIFTIFGGIPPATGTASNEVWTLANANGLGGSASWTELAPTGTPPDPRYYVAAVLHSVSKRMIVVGGQTSGPIANDVWVLTNANGQ